MRGFLIIFVLFVFLFFISCTGPLLDAYGGDEKTPSEGINDPGAKSVVEDFLNFLRGLREKYIDADITKCDDTNPIYASIMKEIDQYYYFDESLTNYKSGVQGAKENVSCILNLSIDTLINYTVKDYGPAKSPYFLPAELSDDNVQFVATVSCNTNDGVIERKVVKVNNKWYIRAVYYKDYEILFYPEREEIFF